MYFHKFHHPVNFVAPTRIAAGTGRLRYPRRQATLEVRAFGGDVFRIEASGPGWERNHSQAGLTPERAPEGACRLRLERDALVLRGADGRVLLASLPGRPLSVSGASWLMEFVPDASLRFFGMGEKHLGWEKKKVRTKFWNTDAWGDFHMAKIKEASYDPAYVSIPYLAVKCGDTWVGILVDCPEAPVISLPDPDETKRPWFAAAKPSFTLGAAAGKPSVWFLVGPTLAELTRKLQRLCGVTPLPPLWALGHHQCRWAYQDAKDLQELADGFKAHAIPDDGLWLDIDYMDRFKVFTWDPALWKGGEAGVAKALARFAAQGHRVVPILDPGVKVEAGYEVYESGLKAGVFCKTREGIPYTGFVWPGETAFPDFSLPKARRWWADRVAEWAKAGVGGAWLDMNDPSVGSAELDDMRFDQGRLDHATFHNQYGFGMAVASREGFLKAFPDRRPFLLCRSGWIGSSRHTAIWTGDNYANWAHLSGSIALSMSLAISGVPFNGPDVPGFGGNTDDALAAAWYKAGFLFPFLRNHSEKTGSRKEPWAFQPATREVIARYVRLRYKLLPYLYNLWIDQELTGEAVMRPLCYDFADGPGQDLAAVGDQFLCGPSLLHAPVLAEGADRRPVVLPPGRWFGLHDGRWLDGGATVEVRQGRLGTPLFVRGGSLLAMQPGERTGNASDLAVIELHAVLEAGGTASCTYRHDDGESFAYRQGARSEVAFTAAFDGRTLVLTADRLADGAGALTLSVVAPAGCRRVLVRHGDGEQELATAAATFDPCGKALAVRATGAITLA